MINKINIQNNNNNKLKFAIIDFDNTLIYLDSFKYIFIKEKLFLNINFLLLLLIIAIVHNFNLKLELKFRTIFKKKLLLYLKNSIPKTRYQEYIQFFIQKINNNIINHIKSKKYDKHFIISASDYEIINNVIKNKLLIDKIISNNKNNLTNFSTCWGPNKLSRLKSELFYYNNYELDLYTDSKDDLYLKDIMNNIYFVNIRYN